MESGSQVPEQKRDIIKTFKMLHLRVFWSPRLAPYRLQIRYWAENGTGPPDLVNFSLKSWIHVNCESEILQKKYISESNTVNNMKPHMFLQPMRSECINNFVLLPVSLF
jgi:hypothetical protein